MPLRESWKHLRRRGPFAEFDDVAVRVSKKDLSIVVGGEDPYDMLNAVRRKRSDGSVEVVDVDRKRQLPLTDLTLASGACGREAEVAVRIQIETIPRRRTAQPKFVG